MKELSDTLNITEASRTILEVRISLLGKPRKTSTADEKARGKNLDQMVDDEDARTLANNIRNKIEERLRHHHRMVPGKMAEGKLSECIAEQKNGGGSRKQALLLHCAALFDINKCEFD